MLHWNVADRPNYFYTKISQMYLFLNNYTSLGHLLLTLKRHPLVSCIYVKRMGKMIFTIIK